MSESSPLQTVLDRATPAQRDLLERELLALGVRHLDSESVAPWVVRWANEWLGDRQRVTTERQHRPKIDHQPTPMPSAARSAKGVGREHPKPKHRPPRSVPEQRVIVGTKGPRLTYRYDDEEEDE